MNIQKILYLSELTLSANLDKEYLLPKIIQPESVTIKLTERCNCRCIMCDYWESNQKDKIDTQRAIKLLDELYGIGVKRLSFTGGETFLRKDFFEILANQPRDRFTQIGVITNGLLLEKYSDLINKSILTHLVVSIDGLKETHDRIRGISGCFDQIISGLKKIRHKDIKIAALFTNKLIPELEAMIMFCQEAGYRFSVTIPSTHLPFFNTNRVRKAVKELTPTKEETDKGLDILEKNNILNSLSIAKIRDYLHSAKFPNKHCLLPFIDIYILSAGDVKTGCYLFKPVGNILEQSLKDILASDRYLQDAKNAYHLFCPKCLCNYGVSMAFENPFSSLKRALKYFYGHSLERAEEI